MLTFHSATRQVEMPPPISDANPTPTPSTLASGIQSPGDPSPHLLDEPTATTSIPTKENPAVATTPATSNSSVPAPNGTSNPSTPTPDGTVAGSTTSAAPGEDGATVQAERPAKRKAAFRASKANSVQYVLYYYFFDHRIHYAQGHR